MVEAQVAKEAIVQPHRTSPFLQPDAALHERLRHLFSLMKAEIDDNRNKDQHILRAMLYETLMLLNRAGSADDSGQPMNEVSTNRQTLYT